MDSKDGPITVQGLPELLTPKQVSLLLGRSVPTLANWRVAGKGPAFAKVGTCVMYPRTSVEAWLESRMRRSTSTPLEGCPIVGRRW